jgi:ABC-type uncharacterized transport system permease subunit
MTLARWQREQLPELARGQRPVFTATGKQPALFRRDADVMLGRPSAPILPPIDLGWWSTIPQVRAALRVNVLFLIGIALAPALVWALTTTRWGLILRTVGESADAARAMGYSVRLGGWTLFLRTATTRGRASGKTGTGCHRDGV